MLKLTILLLLNTFFLNFASAIDVENEDVVGLYKVVGQHSSRGTYRGELEIRPSNSGTLEAVKIITYDNFMFENLYVQEVWTGSAEFKENDLVVKYSLRQGDHIIRLNGQKRSPEDFKIPFLIESRYRKNTDGILVSESLDKQDAIYVENLTEKDGLSSEPLWVNLRTKLYAGGAKIPLWLKPILAFTKKRSGFSKDPYVLSFANREEFKKVKPYIIFDPTDFDFYQKNQNIVRVVNKVIDVISLTESMTRRNSYAFSLNQKADYYEKNIRERHLPQKTNILTYSKMSDNGEFQNYYGDFSGGLWSGLYAGSQAMRYLTTRDPEALETFKKILKGTFTLIDITGDSKQFARSIAPYKEDQINEGWIQGRGKYADLMYMPNGNNDMIKGLTHVLMWATYIIPESDTETWNLMKEKSIQLLNLDIFKKKVQNQPAAVGLAAIINKDEAMVKKFRKLFRNPKIMLSGYSINATFYVRGSADWSGINLGVVGDITEIMIAEKIGAMHISNQVRERLMDSWVTYESSKRSLVTVAAYAFAYKNGIRSSSFNDLDNNETRWSEGLEHAKWGLRGIPAPRPLLDVEINHSMKEEWCLSPVPQLFWKAFKSPPPPPSYFFQGLYDYPSFEMNGYTSNYLWKDSAFDYVGTASKNLESSGADYLYLYWMSRYAGLGWN